jgi:hypothetical protein
MLNLADPQKSRIIPIVFLYMEWDNFFFISILFYLALGELVRIKTSSPFHKKAYDKKIVVSVKLRLKRVSQKYLR